MLTSVKEILNECKNNQKAVGAFNVINLEIIQGAVAAASSTNKPIVIQLTTKTLDYAGDKEVTNLVRNVIELRSGDVPIGLHLDHGKTFEQCQKAIELGFNSVMIDGSALSFEENKNLTKRVVDFAHQHNISVQGELGTVPYLGKHTIENENSYWDECMTDPEQAVEFVKFTGIDSLAVAIGNAHGFQKEREVPDWDRLEKIKKKVDVPLILHGSSDWTEAKIKTAVEKGINCFNVDTDIRVAYISRLCNIFEKGCTMEDPRKIGEMLRNSVERKIVEKILMFTNGK